MNFKAVIGKVRFQVKKHSPEILMAVGIGGMVAGGALAVRATYKKGAPRRVEHNNKIIVAQKEFENKIATEEEVKKEIKQECRSYVLDTVKTYAIPVTVEAAGIACILASNNIMRKRLAGATAAFTTVSTAFNAYRERVKERYGEDVERSIYLNEKEIEVEETDEKGKVKKKKMTVADPDISSIGRYFTRKNSNWSDSEAFLENFFSMQASYLTDKLRGSKGFVILNDIYDAYGFDLDTEAGITVGKVYDRNGDNRIDVVWKKVLIPDEFGNMEDAYYVDWPGLEIIYGKGDPHRSIAT